MDAEELLVIVEKKRIDIPDGIKQNLRHIILENTSRFDSAKKYLIEELRYDKDQKDKTIAFLVSILTLVIATLPFLSEK